MNYSFTDSGPNGVLYGYKLWDGQGGLNHTVKAWCAGEPGVNRYWTKRDENVYLVERVGFEDEL